METLMKQKGMDQDCNTELCLGLSPGIGTNTSEEDQMSASQRNVKGPPLLLDMFPLAPVLLHDSGCRSLSSVLQHDSGCRSLSSVLQHDSGCRSLSSVLQHDSGCRSLSSVLQHDSGCGTLPCEKTSHRMDGGAGGERSAGKEKLLAIHPVTVSWRSDANKFPPSCYYNEDATTSNSTVGSNAINQEHSYAMDFKRKRGATEELQNGRVCSRLLSDVDLEEEGGTKKKLKLSRDQSAILAESFRKNRALEPNQKQALALQLNLLPRQVDVWFRNRRARTKHKQTEVDCEVLKRCNESLVEENRKLQKEVEELRAMKWASPLTVLCPSCQKSFTRPQ